MGKLYLHFLPCNYYYYYDILLLPVVGHEEPVGMVGWGWGGSGGVWLGGR